MRHSLGWAIAGNSERLADAIRDADMRGCEGQRALRSGLTPVSAQMRYHLPGMHGRDREAKAFAIIAQVHELSGRGA